MIIYLKNKMEALQTLIITSTTDISKCAISINTCAIRNKIHSLINNQTITCNNKTLMNVVNKIVPSLNIDLPPVLQLASDLDCVVLEAFSTFVNITNRKHPIR